MKRRTYFRPRRPQNNKDARKEAGGLFGPAKETVVAVLEPIEEQLAGECTPGYPLVDTSARRCTFELARDWTWTARLLDDGPRAAVGLSASFAGEEGAEERVPMDDSLADAVAASVNDFIARFRAR
jgi:hypothetical protein